MHELIEQAVRTATAAGAEYADARHVRRVAETLDVVDGAVGSLGSSESEGVAVRVLWRGGWGFAAVPSTRPEAVARAAADAVAIARASAAMTTDRVRLSPCEPVRTTWRTPVVEDPFALSLDERAAPLAAATGAARGKAHVVRATGQLVLNRRWTSFVSSEGAAIDQEITHTGFTLEVVARSADGVARRSFPAHSVVRRTAGFEFLRSIDLVAEASRLAAEAAELLTAPACPARETTLILTGDIMANQIHESIGHATELDRVLGREDDFGGRSFLRLADLGTLRYGSPEVTVTADATVPQGPGSFGYDDDGVPARRVELIRDGLLVAFQSGRDTAPFAGATSSGAVQSEGWAGVPMVRMTNVNLEPGEGSLADLIADTRDGILMSTTKSWSIDEARTNFQFGTEIAWQIRDGRLAGVYRDPVYTGSTLPFWNSCDAVAGKSEWSMFSGECGKGQPDQVAWTGHGTSPARFRNVSVRGA